jgi:PTH1 family peptidyl-tRNA hydrolase
MKLIIGLGNPDARFRGTRHNAGAEVIDRLAEEKGSRLKRKWRARAFVGRIQIGGRPVTIAKPSTFMNMSGEAVNALMKREGCGSDDLLVVTDDIHLGLGRIRIRERGGSGGHNGLESVISCIGTEDFARLRIGVGPAQGDWVEYVLGRFLPGEWASIEKAREAAIEAIEEIVLHGIRTAMNRFNSEREW